jgi:hypothetical protein
MCPWDEFERTSLQFCEPIRCAWIVNPANAWSNLAHVAIAVILFWHYRRADAGLRVRWLPPIIAINGLIPFVFHASMTRVFAVADLSVAFLFTAFLSCLHLERAGHLPATRVPLAYALLGPGFFVLPFMREQLGFVGLTLQGLFVIWSIRWVASGVGRRDFHLALGLVLSGSALNLLDHHHIGCTTGALAHVVQPHVGWHLAVASALAFFYRYARAVERSGAHASA